MNRKYKIEDFKKIIAKFKKEIPELTISTDVIVAFPDENEQDFNETLSLVQNERFYSLNVSRFWPMKGTPAEKMGQIDDETSKSRADKLMQIYNKNIEEENKRLVNMEVKVLVSVKEKDKYWARDDCYRLVEINSKEDILGKFVNVRITGTERNHLMGECK